MATLKSFDDILRAAFRAGEAHAFRAETDVKQGRKAEMCEDAFERFRAELADR